MESGSSVACSSTRKVKPRKKQKVNEGEDFISKLPKSLISRILSFLPTTEDAVRTSVLSKRWIHLWTTINKLVLKDYQFYESKWRSSNRRRGKDEDQTFVNFVNSTLLLTKGAGMESISLYIKRKYGVSLINTWLSSIFNRSVKHINICSCFEKLPFSPLASHSLFNSESLEELLLQMDHCDIMIPTSYVHFGYLRSLTSTGIKFTVDSSDDHLSLSLPLLKKFKMVKCTWLNAKGITVEAPLLEIIDIEQDYYSASDGPRGSASALHLKKFSYSGYDISRTVILSDPSSTHNDSARVVLCRWYGEEENEDGNIVPEIESCASLLLKQFSQMKLI